MSVTLPFDIKKGTWTKSRTSGNTQVTNSITLDKNSKYLMLLNIPYATISGGYTAGYFRLYGFTSYIRLIDARRGSGLWIINTGSSNVTTYAQNYFSQSTSYTDTGNAALYAIKIGPANGTFYGGDKQGTLLPLDVEYGAWKVSSSAAYNTLVTNNITFKGGHKYLVLFNNANCGNDTSLYPFGLYGNINGTCLFPRSRQSALWVVDRTGVTTDWASGIATAFSGSTNYTNTSYAGVYSIKIA